MSRDYLSNRHSITLCMVVKNEGMLLGQCLKDMGSVVDEIIVVDTGSTDDSIKIAKKYGARIIHYKWNDSLGLGGARNVSIKNATNPWVLVLDADERIAKNDLFKLKRLVKDTKAFGYIFTRRDYTKRYDLLRDWHPNDGSYLEEEAFSGCLGWALTRYVRLFQKKEGPYCQESYSLHIDLDFSEYFKKYKGKIKECDIVIHHFQYLKGESFLLNKQNDYLKREIKHIRIFPNQPWSYLNIGITLFSLKKDNKAIEYLKKAIELNPKFEMAYFILGIVYKENKEFKKAILNLKKAISINPKYADAWTVLGMVYDIQGRLKEAERALKRAIVIHPKHPLAHNSLGIVYQGGGRFLEAEREYKKAMQTHPQHPDAYHNLASLYEVRRRYKETKEKYRIALKINS